MGSSGLGKKKRSGGLGRRNQSSVVKKKKNKVNPETHGLHSKTYQIILG